MSNRLRREGTKERSEEKKRGVKRRDLMDKVM